MYDQDSKGISYTAGFFMLIAFVIAGLLLSSQLTIPIWQGMTGKNIEILQKGTFGPEDSNALKLIQAITTICGFFLPTVVAAYLLNRRPLALLGFPNKGTQMKQVGLVILIIGAALMVSASISYLTNHIPLTDSLRQEFDKLEEEYNQQVTAIISLKGPGDFILALIIMAFLPALCEETMFRGGLQNFLTRGTGKPWLAIIVVSILFSLAHISYYGFFSRMFLGVVLGLIYYYSGKLWLSILAHFINNALAITVLYIYSQQGKPLKDAMREDTATYWGVFAIPALIALFIAFKKSTLPQRQIV